MFGSLGTLKKGLHIENVPLDLHSIALSKVLRLNFTGCSDSRQGRLRISQKRRLQQHFHSHKISETGRTQGSAIWLSTVSFPPAPCWKERDVEVQEFERRTGLMPKCDWAVKLTG